MTACGKHVFSSASGGWLLGGHTPPVYIPPGRPTHFSIAQTFSLCRGWLFASGLIVWTWNCCPWRGKNAGRVFPSHCFSTFQLLSQALDPRLFCFKTVIFFILFPCVRKGFWGRSTWYLAGSANLYRLSKVHAWDTVATLAGWQLHIQDKLSRNCVPLSIYWIELRGIGHNCAWHWSQLLNHRHIGYDLFTVYYE